MALETLVAGYYSHTYNSVATGITREGYRLEQQVREELVDETDLYGNSIIDFVYRGGNVYLEYLSKAYKAGAITPFWPWGALGEMFATATPIGRLASAVAAAAVLTATANTPAATSPATLTGTKAILAPGQSGSLSYNSKIREVPTRLILLPYDTGSNGSIRWFAMT